MPTHRRDADDMRADIAKLQASRAASNLPGAGDLTSDERNVVRTGLEALDKLDTSIYRLFEVGDAVVLLKRKADEMPKSNQRTFPDLLRKHGFDRLVDKQRSNLTHLLQVMEKRDEVVAWHNKLPLHQKLAWLSPKSILRHCSAFQPRRREPSTPHVSTTATNAALQAELVQKDARIQQLNEELASAKAAAPAVGSSWESLVDALVEIVLSTPSSERHGLLNQIMQRFNAADIRAARAVVIRRRVKGRISSQLSTVKQLGRNAGLGKEGE